MKYNFEKKKKKIGFKIIIIIICCGLLAMSVLRNCNKAKAIPAQNVLVDLNDYYISQSNIFILQLAVAPVNNTEYFPRNEFIDLLYFADGETVLQYKFAGSFAPEYPAAFGATYRLYDLRHDDVISIANINTIDGVHTPIVADNVETRKAGIDNIFIILDYDNGQVYFYVVSNNGAVEIMPFTTSYFTDLLYLNYNFSLYPSIFYYSLQTFDVNLYSPQDAVNNFPFMTVKQAGNYNSYIQMLIDGAKETSYQMGYYDGNTDGYQLGYQAGYSMGDSVGYTRGYANGQNEGYATGYQEGHNTGYNEGVERGYNDGKHDGYQEGYAAGRDIGQQEGYGTGFREGRTEGYDVGYSEGVQVNNQEAYDKGVADGKTEQFYQKGFFGWITGLFKAIGDIFNIRLGSFTLGQFVVIPLAITICWAILKLMRGGGS